MNHKPEIVANSSIFLLGKTIVQVLDVIIISISFDKVK